MKKKKPVKKKIERSGESPMSASEVIAGWEKWRKIIHSLRIPEEVLDDDDAFDAAMKERGY